MRNNGIRWRVLPHPRVKALRIIEATKELPGGEVLQCSHMVDGWESQPNAIAWVVTALQRKILKEAHNVLPQ